MVSACKPFAFFISALDAEHVVVRGAELEDEFLPIHGCNQGDLTSARHSHNVGRPAIDRLPVLSTRLVENIVTELADDVFQPLHRVGVLFLFENLHHIAAIRREIDFLHRTAASVLVLVILILFACGERFDFNDAHGVAGTTV